MAADLHQRLGDRRGVLLQPRPAAAAEDRDAGQHGADYACATVRASSCVRPEIHVLGISLKTFGIVFACGSSPPGRSSSAACGSWASRSTGAYEMAFAALVGGLVGSRVYFIVAELQPGQARPAGQPVLRLRAGLVRRGDRRGDRRDRLGRWRGMLNLGAARSGLRAAGHGLRDRADRLPGLRRRRLRQGLDTCRRRWAIPTARCRPRPGSRCQPTPIYETLAMGLVAWWLWRMRDRFRPGRPVRLLPAAFGARAAAGGVHAAQPPGGARA